MNQTKQIARPCPRARAIGRREANPSSLSLSASALDAYGQTLAHETGWGCPAVVGVINGSHAPTSVRVIFVRGQTNAGCSRQSLQSTCRPVRPVGSFLCLGSQPRRQAIADLPEVIHSNSSVSLAGNLARETEKHVPQIEE